MGRFPGRTWAGEHKAIGPGVVALGWPGDGIKLRKHGSVREAEFKCRWRKHAGGAAVQAADHHVTEHKSFGESERNLVLTRLKAHPAVGVGSKFRINAVAQGRISHGLKISGNRFTGKYTFRQKPAFIAPEPGHIIPPQRVGKLRLPKRELGPRVLDYTREHKRQYAPHTGLGGNYLLLQKPLISRRDKGRCTVVSPGLPGKGLAVCPHLYTRILVNFRQLKPVA